MITFCQRVLILLVVAAASASWAETPSTPAISQIRELAKIKNEELTESSGLACSRRYPGSLWTHNDSGDGPRLFLIGKDGQTLATVMVDGARAVDWEDICSFSMGGKHYVLIGDVGDNARRRKSCMLYLIEEPELKLADKPCRGEVRPSLAIEFTFSDGPQDCESVAVDGATRTVYLASKGVKLRGTVFQLTLPNQPVSRPLIAQPVQEIKIALVTAMDLAADRRRMVFATYGSAFQYSRRENETWRQALARPPKAINLPPRRQGESICYDCEGGVLYLTSEGTRQPLWEIQLNATQE